MSCLESQELNLEALTTINFERHPYSDRRKPKGISLSIHLPPSRIPLKSQMTYSETLLPKDHRPETHKRAPFCLASQRCLTERAFEEIPHKPGRNMNVSQRVLKPYLPTKPTKTTTQISTNQHSSPNLVLKLTLQKLPFYQDKETVWGENAFLKEGRKKQLVPPSSRHLQKTKEKEFPKLPQQTSSSISLLQTIKNLGNIRLTQSQVMVVQDNSIAPTSFPPHNSSFKIEESIIHQHSIMSNFILLKTRQYSLFYTQQLVKQRQIGLVLSLKIISTEHVDLISNEVIISRILEGSRIGVELYQVTSDKNKRYVLLREYYEQYLRNVRVEAREVERYLLGIVEVVEEMQARGVLHYRVYDSLVLVNERVKISNFEHCKYQNTAPEMLSVHYHLSLQECFERLLKQISNPALTPTSHFQHIKNLLSQRTPFPLLKQQIKTYL